MYLLLAIVVMEFHILIFFTLQGEWFNKNNGETKHILKKMVTINFKNKK